MNKSKILKIAIGIFLILILSGYVIYQNYPSLRYLTHLSSQVKTTKKIKIDCESNPESACIQNALKSYQFSDMNFSMLVLVKIVSFYNRQKSEDQKEIMLLKMHTAVNDFLKNIKLSNHYLLSLNPIFSFSKRELCELKKAEVENTEKIIEKLSVQADTDRQNMFEKYPEKKELQYVIVRRKEILNQLKADLESSFSKSIASECVK